MILDEKITQVKMAHWC